MKLTNTIREGILSRIITEKYSDNVGSVNRAFQETLEKEVKKQKKDELLFLERAKSVGMAGCVCTEQDIYLTKAGTKCTSQSREDVEKILPRNPANCYEYRISFSVPCPRWGSICIEITPELQTCMNSCFSVYRDVQKNYNALKELLNSCSTTKQLADTLPEIVKYFPVCEDCTMLVSVETVNRCKAILDK